MLFFFWDKSTVYIVSINFTIYNGVYCSDYFSVLLALTSIQYIYTNTNKRIVVIHTTTGTFFATLVCEPGLRNLPVAYLLPGIQD
jgi:hypothetical protein